MKFENQPPHLSAEVKSVKYTSKNYLKILKENPGKVIKLRPGLSELIIMSPEQGKEALKQAGVPNSEQALEKSSANDPLVAGQYVFWFNK